MSRVSLGWLEDDTPKLVPGGGAWKRLKAKAKGSKHTKAAPTSGKLWTAAAARGKAPEIIRLGSDCSGYGSEFLAMQFSGLRVKTVFCAEIDSNKVVLLRRTHRIFNDDNFVLYTDITQRDNSKAPECDIFISGAPCQVYAAAGRGAGLDDMKNRGITLFYSLDYIRRKRPRVVIIENVSTLTLRKYAHVLADICTVLARLGYKITKRVCNTRDHGIPQCRPRLYVIGIRKTCHARKFPWPKPVKAPSLLRFVDDSRAKKFRINDLCETGLANVQYWRRKKNLWWH